MNKTITYVVLGAVVIVGGFFVLNNYIYEQKQVVTAADYKDAEYVINGERIKLSNGIAETAVASGSASKITTRYFGNEVKIDFDNDGREDVAFLLTQETGGSGTFFYVVAALNTESGYVGSQGLFLGDRIAPQTTEVSQNPNHKNVIVVNYAERKPDEPMTTRPSVGKSIWLKLDPQTMQFGEVVQNFEGEADPSRMTLTMKTWNWISVARDNGKEITPREGDKFTLTFSKNGTFSASTDCNGIGGDYSAVKDNISFGQMVSTLMYCEGSQETDFRQILEDAERYSFTSRGELIFDLITGGKAVFR